jgi:hypothetical protein
VGYIRIDNGSLNATGNVTNGNNTANDTIIVNANGTLNCAGTITNGTGATANNAAFRNYGKVNDITNFGSFVNGNASSARSYFEMNGNMAKFKTFTNGQGAATLCSARIVATNSNTAADGAMYIEDLLANNIGIFDMVGG